MFRWPGGAADRGHGWCHRGQPGARALGHTVAGPTDKGLGEGFLHTFLGQVPISGATDENGHDPPPLDSKGFADRDLNIVHGQTNTGLISMAPPCSAQG